MSQASSPFEQQVPSMRRTLISVGIAVLLAALVLVIAVLPAEYGIDPTGIGQRLGLKQMHAVPGKKIELSDVVGGNDQVATVQPPAVGEPLPLPNPAVHQLQAEPAKSETLTITLPVGAETEIKTALTKGKMVLYSWHVDHGQIYVDYHGHNPDWQDPQAFVRYQEVDGSTGANGSLVAPFTGEHGWYWLNTSDSPVVITLTVTGFYDRIVNYGAHQQ
jgi:hypothetical protein